MIKRLWNLLGKYKKLLVISTVLVILEIIFDLQIPVLMQNIIDIGIRGDGGISYVIKCGVQMVFLALLALIFVNIRYTFFQSECRPFQRNAYGDV